MKPNDWVPYGNFSFTMKPNDWVPYGNFSFTVSMGDWGTTSFYIPWYSVKFDEV
jgi:hypothetical protein